METVSRTKKNKLGVSSIENKRFLSMKAALDHSTCGPTMMMMTTTHRIYTQKKNAAIVIRLTCSISVQLPLHYIFYSLFHCLLRNRCLRRHHYHFSSIQFTVTSNPACVPPSSGCSADVLGSVRSLRPSNECYHKILKFNKFSIMNFKAIRCELPLT